MPKAPTAKKPAAVAKKVVAVVKKAPAKAKAAVETKKVSKSAAKATTNPSSKQSGKAETKGVSEKASAAIKKTAAKAANVVKKAEAPVKAAATEKKPAPAAKKATEKAPASAPSQSTVKPSVKAADARAVDKSAPALKNNEPAPKTKATTATKALTKATMQAKPISKAAIAKDPFLSQQQAHLLREREEYSAQAAALKAEAEQMAAEMEPGDTQFDEESGEGGTANIDREHNLRLVSQATQAIEEIDRALHKMEKGTYGLCEHCAQPIAEARLEALPFASLCVQCKSGGLTRR